VLQKENGLSYQHQSRYRYSPWHVLILRSKSSVNVRAISLRVVMTANFYSY